jgi:DNA-binding transcriptional MerR regulator
MPGYAAVSDSDGRRLYSIGDLADEFAISPRTIRFYEDQGLLAPQRIGGNRIYAARDRARLQLVLRGKRLGFALSDIREMLDLYDVDAQHLEQLRALHARARNRIVELEHQLHEVTVTLRELREVESAVLDKISAKEAAASAAEGSGNAAKKGHA